MCDFSGNFSYICRRLFRTAPIRSRNSRAGALAAGGNAGGPCRSGRWRTAETATRSPAGGSSTERRCGDGANGLFETDQQQSSHPMKKLLPAVLLLLLSCPTLNARDHKSRIDSVLTVLDREIENREMYYGSRELRIENMKSNLNGRPSPPPRKNSHLRPYLQRIQVLPVRLGIRLRLENARCRRGARERFAQGAGLL